MIYKCHCIFILEQSVEEGLERAKNGSRWINRVKNEQLKDSKDDGIKGGARANMGEQN